MTNALPPPPLHARSWRARLHEAWACPTCSFYRRAAGVLLLLLLASWYLG